MLKKRTLLFSIIVLALLFLPIFVHAADESVMGSIQTVLDTVVGRDFNWATFYGNYGTIIDSILYFILFIGIAQFALRNKFQENKSIPTIIGIVLAISFSVWSATQDFKLAERLGPLGGIIFIGVLFIMVYYLVRNLGGQQEGARPEAIFAGIALSWYAMKVISPEITNWMETIPKIGPFISVIAPVSLFILIIILLYRFINFAGNARGGGNQGGAGGGGGGIRNAWRNLLGRRNQNPQGGAGQPPQANVPPGMPQPPQGARGNVPNPPPNQNPQIPPIQPVVQGQTIQIIIPRLQGYQWVVTMQSEPITLNTGNTDTVAFQIPQNVVGQHSIAIYVAYGGWKLMHWWYVNVKSATQGARTEEERRTTDVEWHKAEEKAEDLAEKERLANEVIQGAGNLIISKIIPHLNQFKNYSLGALNDMERKKDIFQLMNSRDLFLKIFESELPKLKKELEYTRSIIIRERKLFQGKYGAGGDIRKDVNSLLDFAKKNAILKTLKESGDVSVDELKKDIMFVSDGYQRQVLEEITMQKRLEYTIRIEKDIDSILKKMKSSKQDITIYITQIIKYIEMMLKIMNEIVNLIQVFIRQENALINESKGKIVPELNRIGEKEAAMRMEVLWVCKNCKTPNKKGENFCKKCGSRLRPEDYSR